jgi:putative endopeptidase
VRRFLSISCGNWNKLNPIPPDQARWDVYAKLTDENQRYLWGILDDASKPNASAHAGAAEDRRLLLRLHG